eukprot:1670200-Prymnesium_polylepis.1
MSTACEALWRVPVRPPPPNKWADEVAAAWSRTHPAAAAQQAQPLRPDLCHHGRVARDGLRAGEADRGARRVAHPAESGRCPRQAGARGDREAQHGRRHGVDRVRPVLVRVGARRGRRGARADQGAGRAGAQRRADGAGRRADGRRLRHPDAGEPPVALPAHVAADGHPRGDGRRPSWRGEQHRQPAAGANPEAGRAAAPIRAAPRFDPPPPPTAATYRRRLPPPRSRLRRSPGLSRPSDVCGARAQAR